MKISLIGGSGLLGRHLQPVLEGRGHDVSSFGRSSEPAVDLKTGEGLAAAVTDAEVVVNLASNPSAAAQTDVEGTRRLVEAMDDQHLVYMSIVGVDEHPFPYYRAKYEAETVVANSGVSHTIVRATQFHDFVAFLMSKACRRWMAFAPSGFVFQPIETGEVAANLAEAIEAKPPGLLPDLAGPEVLAADHLARTYMTARGREAPVLKFPVPGKIGRAFREGVHTNPDRAVGEVSWDDYLEKSFQS